MEGRDEETSGRKFTDRLGSVMCAHSVVPLEPLARTQLAEQVQNQVLYLGPKDFY